MHDADGGDPGGTDGDGADGRADESDRTVEELVEYCRVQAGLLAGRVETMADEASERIDEIDEGIADLRDDLDTSERGAGGVDAPESAETANSINPGDEEVASLADAEADLQRKQAMVEATESRMRLFQELSTDYLEIADDLIAQLESGEADPDEAVSRVISFEAERDAPAYFEERETLVEVATAGDEE